MIKKTLKYGGIAIVCLIIVTLASALLYRKYLQHEVSEARAIRSPSGIDSLEAVRIGGIDQWIEVRGQNVNNPILLFIHGGPGVAFIPMGSTFQDPWEKYFAVVQWDQRGAGKTYESNDLHHGEVFLPAARYGIPPPRSGLACFPTSAPPQIWKASPLILPQSQT